LMWWCVFFFFQAEDGIRDRNVTGVQTCALPISDPERGMIHIGFTSSLASYILPTAISQFRAEYPHVKFQLHHGSSNELEDAVIQGAMNMALVGPVPTE